MFRLYVFVLVVAAATADLKINEDLKCADLKPVEHFNLTEYAGKWYEVARIPEEVATYKCATSDYTLDGSSLKMKKTYVDNGKQKTSEITAKLASDAKEAGKLELNFKEVPDKKAKHTTLLVLATDYKNYAVTYICMGEEKDKEQVHFAMVMSRTKKLEGEPKTAVANFMKTLNMKVTKEVMEAALTKDYFTEAACKVQ